MNDYISFQESTKDLSSLAGLSLLARVFERVVTKTDWQPFLPEKKIATKTSSFDKLRAMVLGLIAGADCLDDMDRLAEDPAFAAINGGTGNSARTYGSFLAEFTNHNLRMLNRQLISTALKLHAKEAKDDNFILTCDSTDALQSGLKMEGLAFNYKNNWGLDTLTAFDQFGFLYWHEVRPGNTFTANGAPELIHEVFKRVRQKHRYFLADSGYCNSGVFNACLKADADFVIAARANMYDRFLATVKHWKKSQKLHFHDGRPVEIGHTVYTTGESNHIYRLIVLRAKPEAETSTPLFGDSQYDYVAFITTIGEHQMSDEEIVKLYRSRSNAENFVKELKVGFDMYHYPCQRLVANKAYGLMMALAYNLVRLAGRLLNPKKPLFAKAVRFLLVHIPCQVVRRGRQIIFKMPPTRLKEVQHIYDKICQLGYYATS